MNQLPKKIAIIGIGLVGGSIALGLKCHFGSKITILGSCNDLRRAKLAKKEGIIDEVLRKDQPIPQNTKLIIIATPVVTIPNVLRFLARCTPADTLIIDVGSTKQAICQQAEKILPRPRSFLGTHPMAGGEEAGFENASANLFRNKPWIICPTKTTRTNDIKLVSRLVEILGGLPIILTSTMHDQVVTWASHLSLVFSSILVETIAKQSNWKLIAKVASSGFRDTTRLASFNPNLKADIVATNKENILAALETTKQEIDLFAKLLKEDKNERIFAYFNRSKRIRDNWLEKYFS